VRPGIGFDYIGGAMSSTGCERILDSRRAFPSLAPSDDRLVDDRNGAGFATVRAALAFGTA
jgi:hypothetical protein